MYDLFVSSVVGPQERAQRVKILREKKIKKGKEKKQQLERTITLKPSLSPRTCDKILCTIKNEK